MKKYSSILLLSFSLLSGVAMAGGTTEAGIGGALGGVLGSVVGNSIGGSTGGAIGAGLGGAAGCPGADKRQRGEAAIGGALGAAGGNVVGRSVGGTTGSYIGAAAGGGAGGALGNYMGNKADEDERHDAVATVAATTTSPLRPWPPLWPPQAQAPLARLTPEGLPGNKSPAPAGGAFMPVFQHQAGQNHLQRLWQRHRPATVALDEHLHYRACRARLRLARAIQRQPVLHRAARQSRHSQPTSSTSGKPGSA
jgi:hypothetical protein